MDSLHQMSAFDLGFTILVIMAIAGFALTVGLYLLANAIRDWNEAQQATLATSVGEYVSSWATTKSDAVFDLCLGGVISAIGICATLALVGLLVYLAVPILPNIS